MQTFTTRSGQTLVIRPLTPAILAAADREMGKGEGLAASISYSAEVARLLLTAWKDAEGRDLLSGLKPAEVRKLLTETAGVMPFIADTGKKLADEATKEYQTDSGN